MKKFGLRKSDGELNNTQDAGFAVSFEDKSSDESSRGKKSRGEKSREKKPREKKARGDKTRDKKPREKKTREEKALERKARKEAAKEGSGEKKFGLKGRPSMKKTPSGDSRGKNAFSAGSGDGFSVNVRNTDPMLRIDARKAPRKTSGLFGTILSSLVIAAVFSLFLLSAETPMAIPFVLAGIVMYVATWLIMNKLTERFRLVTILGILLVLIVVLVVMRKYIGNGFELIMNGLFERSEESQAYLYDMYSIGETGESSPTLCMGMAAGWGSSVLGLVSGLLGERWRGTINTVIFLGTLIFYAYLGVIPVWVGMMVLLAVFLISAGSGKLSSTWPLIIAVLLVFGAVNLIDPGESYTVSRANENLRDMLALKTALVQSMEDPFMDEEEGMDDEDWGEDDSEFVEEEDDSGSLTTLLVIIGVILLAIAVAAFILHSRLSKKRKKIRADLNNNDPNIAIGAMFPYAVRWLQCFGINVSNTAFSELIPDVKKRVDGAYAERFEKMMAM